MKLELKRCGAGIVAHAEALRAELQWLDAVFTRVIGANADPLPVPSVVATAHLPVAVRRAIPFLRASTQWADLVDLIRLLHFLHLWYDVGLEHKRAHSVCDCD